MFEIACLNTLHHWRIKHELAAEITAIAHVGDPCRR
jgi:hypothetical protein